ncbi:MAG: peptidase T4 [Robiginitomaculum sp.]|nr:MAG: peptidase T4 [Robiginitomaculum sp.]
MIKTGEKNLITDVAGLKIGHAHDEGIKTGVSVVVPDTPARCAVDVRGGGPGTRETDALGDSSLVENIHAIVLSGGSVYGLAAADAVTARLGAQGIGYKVGPAPIPRSPIVPSAILFDNANGGNKEWGETPPFARLGAEALANLTDESFDQGRIGAGYGATAGLYTGGLGSCSEICENYVVGAMIAANPVGSPYMPNSQCFWAWPYEQKDEFGGVRPTPDYVFSAPQDTKLAFLKAAGAATVIGVVAVDAPLSQKQLRRLAIMAQDGIAMAVQPSHTPLDGDTIFALSTAEETDDVSPLILADLGAAAARCVARALSLGVYKARNDQ